MSVGGQRPVLFDVTAQVILGLLRVSEGSVGAAQQETGAQGVLLGRLRVQVGLQLVDCFAVALEGEVGPGQAKESLLLVRAVLLLRQRPVDGDGLLVLAVALKFLGVGQDPRRLGSDGGALGRRGWRRWRRWHVLAIAATGREQDGQSDGQETRGDLGGWDVDGRGGHVCSTQRVKTRSFGPSCGFRPAGMLHLVIDRRTGE